ncbi:MAG: hypothetical protein HQL32_16225, partial [Planctomycetes bacterium]|nr:hypothetical protein [Planctomycetota bacterium]
MFLGKNKIRLLRHALLLALILGALSQAEGWVEELAKRPINISTCLLALGATLPAFLGQAWMTRTIVGYCGKSLNIFRALGINLLAGLWGMWLPMGSVGYKAMYLKHELNI